MDGGGVMQFLSGSSSFSSLIFILVGIGVTSTSGLFLPAISSFACSNRRLTGVDARLTSNVKFGLFKNCTKNTQI